MQTKEEADVGFLTIQQAAERLGVHRSAIYQAIEAGHLKPVRVLGRTALKRADVDAYEPRAYRDRPGGKSKGGRPKRVQLELPGV